MNNLRLKHTVACQLCLYVPPFLLIILGFILFALLENLVGVLLLIGCSLLALAYLLLLFPVLLGIEIMLEGIRHWQKDRLWFSLEALGEDGAEIKETVLARVRRHGTPYTELTTSKIQPVCVQYKRYNVLTVDYSSLERIVQVYEVSHLDEATYQKILTSAQQIVNGLKKYSHPSAFLFGEERNAPVCRAVAAVILANTVESPVPALVRKPHLETETAILPWVAELSTRRCWFNGMRESYIVGSMPKPAKNVAISLIIRVIFGGYLPLEDNDAFAEMDPEIPEKPFVDCLPEFWTELQEDKTRARIAEAMTDGEVQVVDDLLYVRLGERVASLTVDSKQNPPQLSSDGCWMYPKRQLIAKADRTALKEAIRQHYAEQNCTVIFADEQMHK